MIQIKKPDEPAPKPCPVPGCLANIHPQELCCGPHWHPLTDLAKQSWFHANCAHLRGAIADAELETVRRRSLGLEPLPEEEVG